MSYLPNLLLQSHGESGKAVERGEGPRPNILFIMLDTVRADRLSCYGYERETTPFLDSFARGATLFENAIAQAPWTLPSHASFFTGTYPSVNDAHGEHMFLDDSFVTLAEMLRDRGYHTLCFSNNPYLSHFTGLDQGFNVLEEVWMKTFFLDDPLLVSLAREVLADRLPDNGARLTNRIIRRWFERNYNAEQPHFLFINYMDAHYPTRYLPGISERFLRGDLDAGDLEAFRIRNQLDFYPGGGGISEREFEILNVLYDGGIRYLDSKIAEIIGFLESKGVLDDALVIIASDHGEEIGDHQEWGHQFALYDTLIRVPLILRLPGVFPEGLRVPEQVALIDILPTMLDLLGEELEPSNRPELAGQSLLGYLDGEPSERDIASELARPFLMVRGLSGKYPDVDFGFLMKRMRSIRTPAEKLIWSSDADHELYRFEEDPGEIENLFPGDADLAGELMKKLDRFGLSFRERDTDETGFVMTPGREAEEKLKALGYIR
ncbi:sulfatase [Thermodesulfobacteriota bacterium]